LIRRIEWLKWIETASDEEICHEYETNHEAIGWLFDEDETEYDEHDETKKMKNAQRSRILTLIKK
jgi:hypothetical protein